MGVKSLWENVTNQQRLKMIDLNFDLVSKFSKQHKKLEISDVFIWD